MTCPLTTSKLKNQDSMPRRTYSNSLRNTCASLHGYIGMPAFQCLHAGQLIQANRAFLVFGQAMWP
jgi:hypothetical protein